MPQNDEQNRPPTCERAKRRENHLATTPTAGSFGYVIILIPT